MATYTVKAAQHKRAVEGQYGPMQVITLTLQEYGSEPVIADWFTKATTNVPVPGEQLEGDVSQGKYGLEFKKAAPAGGFGGGRVRSPEETRQIVRQHSQHMALQYAAIRQAQGELPAEKFTMENLWKLVDAFDRDAQEGWKK